eukprot:TRINITY_DN67269_c9_g2_i1.p1 TRINITY_DN67269_c9_g2~~TRINITY_DN67269_c9_g2_i1.p1  ORF type:complete len:694 (+),score=116.74 TRINITY_DN67269_c9_g2_i1:17-2098(+)
MPEKEKGRDRKGSWFKRGNKDKKEKEKPTGVAPAPPMVRIGAPTNCTHVFHVGKGQNFLVNNANQNDSAIFNRLNSALTSWGVAVHVVPYDPTVPIQPPPKQKGKIYTIEELLAEYGGSSVEPKDLYEIHLQIDIGTCGRVLKATTRDTKRQVVAIKQVPKGKFAKTQAWIETELSLLKQCDHKNVVKFHAVHRDKVGSLWIVMEFMKWGKLTNLLDILQGPPACGGTARLLSEAQIGWICREMLRGLDYLHKNFGIHRDIKTDNVLVGEHGSIKLADFSHSALLVDVHEKRESSRGTPHWMSPEIIEGKPYGTAADIWSLGIVVLELLDGTPPRFSMSVTNAMQATVDEPPPQPEKRTNISPLLQSFLSDMLAKDQTKRLTAEQLLQHPFILSQCDENTPSWISDLFRAAIDGKTKQPQKQQQPPQPPQPQQQQHQLHPGPPLNKGAQQQQATTVKQHNTQHTTTTATNHANDSTNNTYTHQTTATTTPDTTNQQQPQGGAIIGGGATLWSHPDPFCVGGTTLQTLTKIPFGGEQESGSGGCLHPTMISDPRFIPSTDPTIPTAAAGLGFNSTTPDPTTTTSGNNTQQHQLPLPVKDVQGVSNHHSGSFEHHHVYQGGFSVGGVNFGFDEDDEVNRRLTHEALQLDYVGDCWLYTDDELPPHGHNNNGPPNPLTTIQHQQQGATTVPATTRP